MKRGRIPTRRLVRRSRSRSPSRSRLRGAGAGAGAGADRWLYEAPPPPSGPPPGAGARLGDKMLLNIAEYAGGQTAMHFGQMNRELRKNTRDIRKKMFASKSIPKISEGFVIGKCLHLFLEGSSLTTEAATRATLRLERDAYGYAPPKGCAKLTGRSIIAEGGEGSMEENEGAEYVKIQQIRTLLKRLNKAEIHYFMLGKHRTVPVYIKEFYVDPGDDFYGVEYGVVVCP